MKLFVDDIRACPEGWHPARTVTEAIRVLATIPVDVVSLDHDIASECTHLASRPFSAETFEAVARYIALMPRRRWWNRFFGGNRPFRPEISIHTGNFPMGDKMAEIMGIDYRWPEEYIW